MKEISLNILDILQNAIDAGSSAIRLDVAEDTARDALEIEVTDNGKGMDARTAAAALDPFMTTNSKKKVGLGLPLLRDHAQMCDGDLVLSSEPGKGTKVRVWFRRSHIDRMPMGDLAWTVATALSTHQEIEFSYSHRMDDREFSVTSSELREAVDGLPLSSPPVFRGIAEFLQHNIDKLYGGNNAKD
jgi:anti-sigma regulatory factor (Ser/Thr protein kinase)